MPRYASETSVSPERSRGEIEATLRRYRAERFFYGWKEGQAIIGFSLHGHTIRLAVPMPDSKEAKFQYKVVRGCNKPLTEAQKEAVYEQAVKQRWRALLLLVKANLEAVDLGLLSVEEAFLGSIVLKSGQTVGQVVVPQLEAGNLQLRLVAGD